MVGLTCTTGVTEIQPADIEKTTMRQIKVFNNISLDGYFVDQHGGMSWAHKSMSDPEFHAFVQNNAEGNDSELLFGRITYEMMASFWPSQFAIENNPVVAKGMNSRTKHVASRTLSTLDWENSLLLKGDLVPAVAKLKSEPGKDLVIFGSGNIISQLADAGLIDEYQFVIIPVVLGGGRTLFHGLEKPLELKLTTSRAFSNGNVFVTYTVID